MNKKLLTAAATLLLAVGLFAAGALGPLSPGPTLGTTLGEEAPAALLQPLTRASDVDETIATLETRLGEDPSDARSHALLGLAYLQKSRSESQPSFYVDAERSLRRSLSRAPEGNLEGLLGMGILQASRHRFHDALRWGRRAHALDEFNADALGVITDALIELGRYRAAGRALDEMLSLRPDVSSYARASFYAQLHGDDAGALRAMRLALDAAGGSEGDTAWVSHHLADVYLSRGDLAKAGLYHGAAGRFGGIGTSYSKIGRAEVAIARGNTSKAIRLLEAAVAERPSIEASALLGDLYSERGDDARARAQFDKMHSLYRLESAAGSHVEGETAAFYADHGSPRKALRDARLEYRRRKSIEVADTYSWALYRNGSYRKARRLSERARRLGTNDAGLYFHAGMIELRLGHAEAAERHLRRAIELEPFRTPQTRSARKVVRRLR